MVKKLIARAFCGYRAGPGPSCRHWGRLSHWASGSLFVQTVKHAYDRQQGPQGFKNTLWKWGRHWAWGLQSLLPFPPLPPFLFSKHKTQRGCNLASMGKGGTSCSSEWHCNGNGRNAWKGISRETQLRLPGRWQISYWHSTCCLCHCSWILADSHKKKECSTKERWIHGKLPVQEALGRISRAVLKERTKLKEWLLRPVLQLPGEGVCFCYLVFPFRWSWTALPKRIQGSVNILIII